MHRYANRFSCSAAWAVAGLLLLGACDSKEEKKEDPAKDPITIQGKTVQLDAKKPADATDDEPEAEDAGDEAGAADATAAGEAEGADAEAGDDDGAREGDGDTPEQDDGGAEDPEPKSGDPKPKADDKKPDDKKSDDKKSDDKKPDDTKTASANGKTLYLKKCKNCHGVTGEADTKIGEKHDIPSWKEAGWKAKWTHAKIVDIVTEGKAGTKMKAFEGKLTPEEIQAVSKYARSLGK